MPPRKKKDYKIIVGVDYGTTYTGVAWVESTAKSADEIRIIKNWPGNKGTAEAWKTPSKIAYAEENPDWSKHQWGYQVNPKMTSCSWTKLLLQQDVRKARKESSELVEMPKTEGDALMRLPTNKSPVQVISDYLTEVYSFIQGEIGRRISSDVLAVTPFEFWFTVPAIWSEQAKHATKEAAGKAGFGSRPGDFLYIMTEPEAAAGATLEWFSRNGVASPISPGDGVLICDCGGGTIDITTYKIKRLRPILDYEEMLVGTGGKFGSTYIDRGFHKWMSEQFWPKFDFVPFEKKGPGSQFMKTFENFKQEYDGIVETALDFEMSLVIPGARTSPHYDQLEKMVKISSEEMRGFFEPVVGKIICLLEHQMERITKDAPGCNIDVIILVGGFGDSRYLNDRIQEWCNKNGAIKLVCPKDPQAAIVKGAALRGLKGVAPAKKRSRFHYGFDISEPFKHGIDPPSDLFIDPFNGREYCYNYVEWRILKGQFIMEDTIMVNHLRLPFNKEGGNKLDIDLYSCDLDTPPKRTTDPGVKKISTIKFDMNKVNLDKFDYKVSKGNKFYDIDYVIEIAMGAKEGVLRIVAKAGSDTFGSTEMKYAVE